MFRHFLKREETALQVAQSTNWTVVQTKDNLLLPAKSPAPSQPT
jgi:hypothetical protein